MKQSFDWHSTKSPEADIGEGMDLSMARNEEKRRDLKSVPALSRAVLWFIEKMKQKPGCYCLGKNKDILKYFSLWQTAGAMNPQHVEYPQWSHSGRRQAEIRCHPEKDLFLRKRFHIILAAFQTILHERLERRQCWWAGPHLSQDCLAIHASCLLFESECHIRTLKMDLRRVILALTVDLTQPWITWEESQWRVVYSPYIG